MKYVFKRDHLISYYSYYGCYTINSLKVQSCKLYSCKYKIASTQITNTEIVAFIAFLAFKLLRRKILFINRKDNRNC